MGSLRPLYIISYLKIRPIKNQQKSCSCLPSDIAMMQASSSPIITHTQAHNILTYVKNVL